MDELRNQGTTTKHAEGALAVSALNFSVRDHHGMILQDITLDVPRIGVTAIIGPSASGKSAFLRCINRLLELDGPVQTSGSLRVLGQQVYSDGVELRELRRRVGMVFSKPMLPVSSIFDNVAMSARLQGVTSRGDLAAVVEQSLQRVGLWSYVAEKLSSPAADLSLEWRQRLCIARVLANRPDMLLYDEPTADMDFPSVSHIEDIICDLAQDYPTLVTAQTPQQASHLADFTAFFWQGKLIEAGPTDQILTCPANPQTEAYVTGRYA
ncbi:MAG: ATP-binding cassette domain-containing protein [Phycisphaerales bacterium]|nr:ATP-binding cassette domain-containing protein [Phycisphaerales bacterium]